MASLQNQRKEVFREESTRNAKEPKQAPPVKYRYGNVTINEWSNKSKDGTPFNTYTIQKSYKDGDKWKNTEILGSTELLKLHAALTALFADKAGINQYTTGANDDDGF